MKLIHGKKGGNPLPIRPMVVGVASRTKQRISEHQDACRKGEEKKSAVAEHAWKEHQPIRWQEIDRASGFGELRVKEALHIHQTPEDQRFNRDVGLELPGCWVSTLKALCVKPHPPPSV